MTRNVKHDGSITCDDGASWSDLNQDLLFLVINQLGVNDFLAFSGVCKSWRSLALSKRCKFMASRSPISIRISIYICDKNSYCYLKDPEGRKFKISLPYCADYWRYIGSTCGYLILYSIENKVFCLVNPITKHKLYFPNNSSERISESLCSAILVFSCSISRWVFVMVNIYTPTNIHFCIAGHGTWKRVSSTFPIIDLEAFSGRIYALNDSRCLYELRLDPDPKLVLLETKKFPISVGLHQLVSSCKNLYLREYLLEDSYKLDFEEMNWVSCETTREECVFVHSTLKPSGDGKRKSRAAELLYIPMIAWMLIS